MFCRTALIAVVENGIWGSLLDFLLLLAIAMLLGSVAERFRQSAVVGYLVAGTLIGPGGLGWVVNQEQINGLAELGVALLLFTIGLELSPRQLLQLGRLPLIAGPLQIVLTLLLSILGGIAVGLSLRESIVVGAMVTLSSTACVLRVLRDRAEIDSQYGRASLGILLMQDAAVVPLVLMVTALAEGGTLAKISLKVFVSVMLAFALIAGFYALFNWFVPRIFVAPTLRRNRDLPVLLAVCMAGGAAWSANALELSPALGAFVAGVLLAASPFAIQIQADIQPLRTVLVTLFFAAIGMFGDIQWFMNHISLVLATVAAIVVGKSVLVALLCWIARLPVQNAVATGFCLAQIGEFSFVLATVARNNQELEPVLSETAFRALVSATILALLLTPYLVAVGPRVGSWLERTLRRHGILGRWLAFPAQQSDATEMSSNADRSAEADRIMIIGFGPAGQRVAENLLAQKQEKLVVVDMNLENIRIAQRYGVTAYVGDATQTDLLEHAGIQLARVVVITVPNPLAMRRLIYHVRHLAPGVLIIARGRYHIYRWEMLQAGAHVVIDEEEQVGEHLAQAALQAAE